MTSKKCNKCKKSKPISSFGIHKRMKDGRRSECSECNNRAAFLRIKTKHGLVTRIYACQRRASQNRNMSQPDYSLHELRLWAIRQPMFHYLYDNWAKSGYKKELSPSFDRLDDYKSYTFDNIQIMTWAENRKKYNSDVLNGVNNKRSVSVVQMNMNGTFVAEHYSIHQAGRKTGVEYRNIHRACIRSSSAGGFRWMKSLDIPIANNREKRDDL